MKTATLPPVRITPDLREQLDQVLHEGESVSSFVNDAVRQHIEQRQTDQTFIARAWAAHDKLRRGGPYLRPEDVLAQMRQQYEAAAATKIADPSMGPKRRRP